MRRTPLLTLAAAAVIGTTLVGCGGSDDDASGCTPGAEVAVHGTDELKFDSETYDAEPGCVGFEYINDGSTSHTLLIKGVSDFKLSIGSEDTGAVELDAGSYILYCDVSGHEAAGMEAELTVG